jgi:drug/metabolite transporter (DMT)-like permease
VSDLVLGIASACVAAALFDVGVALQALEARTTAATEALRPSLLGRLARSRRWLAGTALAGSGYPFHLLALVLAPLTAVQPVLAIGLLLLLVLGDRMLGERVGPREVIAVVAIVAGVAGMAWAAPGHASTHGGVARVGPALGVIGGIALAPYALRRRRIASSLLVPLAAGSAFAFTGIASKLIADYLDSSSWGLIAVWFPVTCAFAAAGLLSEMSALQRRAATQVVPIVFVVQICVPVLLAPFLGGESWSDTPLGGVALVGFLAAVATGAWLLGSAPGVSGLVAASHRAGEGERPAPASAG